MGRSITITNAKPTFMRFGTSFSPKIGATIINAKMRTNGKKTSLIQEKKSILNRLLILKSIIFNELS